MTGLGIGAGGSLLSPWVGGILCCQDQDLGQKGPDARTKSWGRKETLLSGLGLPGLGVGAGGNLCCPDQELGKEALSWQDQELGQEGVSAIRSRSRVKK